MNADAAKWLTDYHKVFDLKSFGLRGKELVIGYDINNCEAYEELSSLCKTLVVMDDLDFFNRWSKRLSVKKLCGATDLSELVVCGTVAEAIVEMETAHKSKIIGIVIAADDVTFCRNFVNEWENKKMKKFDLVVGNPPYNNDLDLKIHKILEECVKDDGTIAFVHPADWLITRKFWITPDKGSDVDKAKIESVTLFDGNNIFNIHTPILGITIWRKNKDTRQVRVIDRAYTNKEYCTDCDEISRYGNFNWIDKWLKTIIYPIVNENGSIPSKAVKEHDARNKVGMCLSTGGSGVGEVIIPLRGVIRDAEKGTFFTKPGDVTSDGIKRIFLFSSKKEMDNFINYLKTKAVRFILSIFKFNQQIFRGEMSKIPWMDFSRSYSDKDLRKMWKIDDKLWAFIEKNIPDLYPDYHFDGFYEDDTSKKLKSKVDELVDDAE